VTEREFDLVVGRLLQVGVLLAAAVVCVGIPYYLTTHAGAVADFRVFTPQPEHLRHVGSILAGVGRLDAGSIVQLGVLLLVLTPIARVLFTFIAFVVQRDRAFVLLSGIVLALLLFGLISGRA